MNVPRLRPFEELSGSGDQSTVNPSLPLKAAKSLVPSYRIPILVLPELGVESVEESVVESEDEDGLEVDGEMLAVVDVAGAATAAGTRLNC